MIDGCGNNNKSDISYLHTPGKFRTVPLCEDANIAYNVSDKIDNKIDSHTDDEDLLNNLFCRDIRKIDQDLKDLHERWSNID